MKKLFLMLLAVIAIGAQSINATPDIKDALRGLAGKTGSQQTDSASASSSSASGLGALGGLISGLAGNGELTVKDLVGDWKYSAPAVGFKSDNLLQKAGGAAASAVITNKLAPYYKRVGIENMTATFTADSTFSFNVGKVKLNGKLIKDAEGGANAFLFQFSAVGKIPLGKIKTEVARKGKNITIMFDASKLISIVNAIAKVSGKSSLQAVSSLLNSYDGLACGYELAPAGSAVK